MGLLDSLFGTSDPDPDRVYETAEETRIARYVFASMDAENVDSLGEFDLMYGPDDDGELTLFHAADRYHFDPEDDWQVIIYHEGAVIQATETDGYQTLLGQLVTGDHLEAFMRPEYDCRPLPEEFTGVSIPEQSALVDEQLQELALSVNVDV